MSCAELISPCELNILLIPKCLKGKSYKYICSFIESCSKKAILFIHQVLEFSYKMSLAKQYTAERKLYCHTKVVWPVCNSPLVINHKSLSNYYDFYSSSNTGFAFILRKVNEVVYRNKVRQQMIQDGKEDICGNSCKRKCRC